MDRAYAVLRISRTHGEIFANGVAIVSLAGRSRVFFSFIFLAQEFVRDFGNNYQRRSFGLGIRCTGRSSVSKSYAHRWQMKNNRATVFDQDKSCSENSEYS